MSFYVWRHQCRIKVSFYFFALLCAAALFDRSGILLWGLLAALLHEGGHLAAMLCLSDRVPREISLTPFGIRIENSPLSAGGRGHVLILAAGSGMNALCAAVTFGFLHDFAAVSLLLGVFNLLPVEGMDGGGILRAAMEKLFSESASARVTKAVSRVTLLGMALLGGYVFYVTGYNFSLLGASAALALRGMRHKG